MSDRAFTLAGALVALFALYVLLGGGETRQPGESRPHTNDIRDSGLAGLARWLEVEQVPVTSLRRRYDWLLSDTTLPATGNLLVTSVPHFTQARSAESESLVEWIARGNSILVLAAFYEAPQWVFTAAMRGNYAWPMLDALLPIEVSSTRNDEAIAGAPGDDVAAVAAVSTKDDLSFVPVGAHPVLDRVSAIEHSGNEDAQTSESWLVENRIVIAAQAPVLTLLTGETSDEAVLWLTPYMQGRIIVSALPEVFSNGRLAQTGHAQLAANIVNYARDDGHVIFDDMHQGITTLYDPDAFFADLRLYKSLAFLIALWLAWLLGSSSRFYLGEDADSVTPGRAAFISATGGFLARSLRPATCARELFAHFFSDLRRSGRYRNDIDFIWRRLAADAPGRARAVSELETTYASLGNDSSRIDLRRIHNLMQAIRRDVL